MREIEAMTSDLPVNGIHVMKYETLCEFPQRELERICAFLGVEFSDKMLSRPMAGVHHIGGSPSKFDRSRTNIILDRSYESRFNAAELADIRSIVGPTAGKWGY